tara:strand:+ start:4188 stop:4694 length:507 start_codon:yes stop_codon:yes gene_type:complete
MNLEINTLNLVIKKPSNKDINALVSELNNWNISKWLVEVPFPYSINDANYWIKKTKEDEFSFNIYLRNKLIGGIGITNKFGNNKWELGYWIGETYWGNKYAKEASEGLIKYFFNNTSNNIIYASHMKDNIKSNKIILSLGFTKLGIGKKYSVSRKKEIDDVNYQLIKS